MSSAITAKFQSLQVNRHLALMPFLVAGDPNLETTADILLALQQAGADMVELGIPYSDPLADGPQWTSANQQPWHRFTFRTVVMAPGC